MGEFGAPYDYPELPPPSSKPLLNPAKGGGVTTFLELLDTFNDYTGHGLKFLRVSADETRIEITELLFESDKHYEHVQGVANVTWYVEHNLGKYPSVEIVSSSNKVVEGDVQYIDTNNLTITFIGAFSGKAYMN